MPMMDEIREDRRRARAMLKRAQVEGHGWQMVHEREIAEAFRILWCAGMSEDDFVVLAHRIVLSPRLLYILLTEPRVVALASE